MSSAVWRVVAVATPRVLRRCARCDVVRAFVSSDRFRVNANGRKVDVWLVYRCASCEVSWNRTVLERRTPEEIGPLLARYETNDRLLAWKHAFETDGLSVEDADVRVERTDAGDAGRLVLVVPWPVRMRLDRLLARELGVPRSRLSVADPRALRKPIRDGQVVEILS